MSSTKSQVAVATNIPNISSSNQPQKEYNANDDSLGRQNSFGLSRRGTMKGKHLTRSHAMREATSPPRTPTPRSSENITSSSQSQMSPNGYQQPTPQQQQLHHHHMDVNDNNLNTNHNNNNSNISNSNINNNNKLHTQSSATRGNSPIIDTPTVIVTSQHKQQQLQQPQQQQQHNVALCNEAEFPKLSPPKSKSGGGGGGGVSTVGAVATGGSVVCSSNNGQPQRSIDGSATSNSTNINMCNKKTNGESSGGISPETHSNKATANVVNSNSNKNYNQPQPQQQQQSYNNAGNSMQKALKMPDNCQQQQQSQQHAAAPSQSSNVYNSPMNFQLHPNDGQQQQSASGYIVYDKENRCPRNDSQNSVNSGDEMHYMEAQQQQHNQHHQQQHSQHQQRVGGGGGGGGKKHRTNSNSKSLKPRLKNMGGASGGNGNGNGSGASGSVGPAGGPGGGGGGGSMDGSLNSSNNTSGFISRENSNEQYTDHGGTDLLSFFKETLNKNIKDRQFLLNVEKDLIEFVQEGSRGEIRFPQASSYNRMLIHRTAAFFGMEHNVDTETQQCVIVASTKNTRIPDIRFKTLVGREDSRKSILKRDTHSFDEARQSSYLCPDRGAMLDRKAKSFEEREEDYDRARSRIFNRTQNEPCGGSTDDESTYISWTSTVEHQQYLRGRSSGKVLKIQNSPDGRSGSVVAKANNTYNNYGPPHGGGGGPPLMRGDSVNSNKGGGASCSNSGSAGGGSGNRVFSKQDSTGSTNTSWRLSPSSSGYKTQSQSVHSDSVTPSPTGVGYVSDEHMPDYAPSFAHCDNNMGATTIPSLPYGLVWAVTDFSSVPKGSVLINPQTLQPILNSDGTVYHFDPSNMPPPQVMSAGVNNSVTCSGGVGSSGGGGSGGGSIYHSNQSNTSPQQHVIHNNGKKQHNNKGHVMSQPQQSPLLQQPKCQQQFNTIDSTTSTASGGDTVSSESATQTLNTGEEGINKNLGDVNYIEDTSTKDDNDDCDNNSATGCLSITTTTSTKNYDRIEVQKFKNQATSPNIPHNDKEEITKFEHSSQTPTNAVVVATPQQQQPQHRETPHSARSTPFSNSDTMTKRSSEEPRTTTWTQSYQAPDGSTVFHTNAAPTGSNPYCTTTYQQAPDGSIYAVPQGMIYAYQPPPVEGEIQGYFMPVFDPSQQRAESTSLIQSGAQAIYQPGGTATMVPLAAYPTAQFTTANGAPIYPGQVIYSGEQFTPANAPMAAATPAAAAGQLQQIPMTTYPIGYPYPYNGYWGQTMTYYVPQQAVPATSLLTAQPPPPSAQSAGSHVAGGVNISGPSGPSSTAGPSMNSSNAANPSGASAGCVPNNSHLNGPSGYQSHGSSGGTSGGSHNNNGTTYYGSGRVKRSNPPHFSSGAPQVMATAAIPNGVSATTYQFGHAVPTLTLAATGPPATTAGVPATSDLSATGATPTTTTMYALPQHATIFPTNMFPYAANAAQAIGPQPPANMGQQATLISQHGTHQVPASSLGHHSNAAAAAAVASGAIHNSHHSNTVITPFYTTAHHHNPHASGIHAAGHTIHAPGPAAIPIVDPASLINASQSVQNSSYGIRGSGGNGANSNNASQSAPSTPHSMPSSAPHYSQRNPPAFSTPPIMNNNTGGGYNSASSTPQYYSGGDQNNHGHNSSNSPHNSYTSGSYEKRNNNNANSGGGGKKSLAYQSASLSRQNSTSAGNGYSGSNKPASLLGGGGNNNDTRASPGSNSTNSRPHSMKRSGGPGSGNEKPQTPLLSGPPSFTSNANVNNAGYQTGANIEMTASGVVPVVSATKPPIRLNAAAAAFRHKGSSSNTSSNTVVDYRRNPASQRNSPSTNTSSSNDNSNNNSPNSIHNNSSNAATPVAAGCYAPTYIINAQNNGAGDGALNHPPPPPPPSLYITTTARGPAHHIPPHLQNAASTGTPPTAVQAAAAAATNVAVTQQTASAVLGGAAAAAAAADVANAAAVAAASVAHHHHHPQPLLGTYNPGASGLYFKYGHTYFAHPSVALPNSRRSPSTDMRPPIAQMAGMYPAVNMMIPGMPAQPRHPGRHPNPNYKGTRPR